MLSAAPGLCECTVKWSGVAPFTKGRHQHSPALILCSHSLCRCMNRMIWVNKWQVWKGWWSSLTLSQARPFNTHRRIDELNFRGPLQHYQLPMNSTPVSKNANQCTGQPSRPLLEDPEAVQKEAAVLLSWASGVSKWGLWGPLTKADTSSLQCQSWSCENSPGPLPLQWPHCHDEYLMFFIKACQFLLTCRSSLTKGKCIIEACTLPWQTSASWLFCFQI